MRSDDLVALRAVMDDLCLAYNRPVSDRLVTVFFDSLKNVPFGVVRARAELHRRISKKFPTPHDLRPDERPVKDLPPGGPSIQEQLCEFCAKHLVKRVAAGRMPHWQYSQPWTYLYRRVQWVDSQKNQRDEHAECTSVVIPAYQGHPGYRVTVEDMHAGYFPDASPMPTPAPVQLPLSASA